MGRRDDVLKYFNAQAPLWRERAARGVEEHRKGNAYLCIADAEGNPVEASVRLRQKTHDFKYGANIFMLDEFEKEEDNAEYRRMFKEYFNE